MSTRIYGADGQLVQLWDDDARTYTDFRNGATASRAYTAEENARADAEAAALTAETNRATIERALADSLAALQAIIDDTNANINTNPAARIKDLARVQRRLIRLVIRRFDGTA